VADAYSNTVGLYMYMMAELLVFRTTFFFSWMYVSVTVAWTFLYCLPLSLFYVHKILLCFCLNILSY